MDTTQTPSTVIPVITQWGHEQWVTVTRMETMHRLSSVDLHASKPTWLWPLLSIQSASSRDQHGALYVRHSSGDQPATPVEALLNRTLSTMAGGFVLNVIKTYSGQEVLSVHAAFLPKLRSMIDKMPYPPSRYCTQICFSLKNSLHSKLSVTMSPCSWNSLVLPHSASP